MESEGIRTLSQATITSRFPVNCRLRGWNVEVGAEPKTLADTGVVLQSSGAGPDRFPAPVLMKARIIITPKKAVLDPQGKTVQNALEHMGHSGITGVHVGKYIEIDLAPGTDKAAAEKSLRDAAHRFLSNPVIEDFRLELVD